MGAFRFDAMRSIAAALGRRTNEEGTDHIAIRAREVTSPMATIARSDWEEHV
jgi:hypothetical protein